MSGIVCVVMLVMCSLHVGEGTEDHRTKGGSGELCGSKRCLANNEAYCVKGTCVCNSGFKNQIQGDGTLACYKKNKIYAFIKGEPQVKTYDNSNYDFNLPCRYVATAFTSWLKIDKQQKGTCECEMYAWNAKHRGKMYPQGFDLACRITRTDGHENLEFSTRKSGIAENGVYTHHANITMSYKPNGPWSNATHIDYNSNGLIVKCNYNDDNNMARNHYRECGFRVEFRPFDVTFGRYQRQQNGLAWGLSCAHRPQLRLNDRSIVSGPSNHNGIPMQDFLDRAAPQYRLSPKQFMLFHALASNTVQNQPDASPQCSALPAVAALCDTDAKRFHAANRCTWIFTNQPFLACIDPSTNADFALGLLKECLRANCDDNLQCLDFQAHLDTIPARCKLSSTYRKPVRKYNAYLDGSICAP